jgi:hypothetical protein
MLLESVQKPDRQVLSSPVLLLEGDESGGVGGTNTRATVLDGLVGDGELTQVVTNHLRLKIKIRSSQYFILDNRQYDRFRTDECKNKLIISARLNTQN